VNRDPEQIRQEIVSALQEQRRVFNEYREALGVPERIGKMDLEPALRRAIALRQEFDSLGQRIEELYAELADAELE